MPAPQSCEDKLEACINALLREEYPLTQTSMVNAVASVGARRVARDIVQRKSACKKGIRSPDFMDLPAEICNKIYEYAFKRQPCPWFKDDDSIMLWSSWGHHVSCRNAQQPALTKVSRQLRKDTLPTFYALNRFLVVLEDPEERKAGKFSANRWLAAIGAHNASFIEDITIEYRPLGLDID